MRTLRVRRARKLRPQAGAAVLVIRAAGKVIGVGERSGQVPDDVFVILREPLDRLEMAARGELRPDHGRLG